MKDNVILSIVVPVYNSGSLLRETIDSIRKVDFSYPYEVILVNDGSTDSATLELLKEYRFEFKVIDKENGGPSSARNLGISQAKGKYILPFDADDVMHKNHYDLALQKMIEDETIDILYGDYVIFGSENGYHKSGVYNRLRLIYRGCFLPALSIYKKKVWESNGGYDENIFYAEDWDFWSRSAVKNFSFYYFPKPLYNYRRVYNSGSLSQNKEKHLHESVKIIKSKIPASVFTQESISEYVVLSVRENRRLKIKLVLQIFFPRIFNFLLKKGYFPNRVVVE